MTSRDVEVTNILLKIFIGRLKTNDYPVKGVHYKLLVVEKVDTLTSNVEGKDIV